MEEFLNGLFEFVKNNPIFTLVFVVPVIGKILGLNRATTETPRGETLSERTRRDGRRASTEAQAPAPTTATDDLEERIRRNFEEMLRRRSGAAGATSPAATRPSAPRITEAERSRRSRSPKAAAAARPPRNYDASARREATTTEASRGDQSLRRSKPPRTREPTRRSALSSASESKRAARPASHLRLPRLDRAGLRRAILVNEVLGLPRALQEEIGQR
ncbi:MAG: hypothetical protein EXS13_04945 [Planctomycetes bacterium]|nr:hypothetical protein [Planctomycetota bacterium]